MKSKDEIGTPFDDGVRRGVKGKYANKARAQIEHYEKHGYPTGTETGPDPLDTAMEAAVRYMKVAHENADIEKARAEAAGEDPSPDILADARHTRRLHAELGNLREALDGGDVRHAARAGVAFGKALEEMRVRLGATAVKRGRKTLQAAREGHAAVHGTQDEKEARWAAWRESYRAACERNPHMLREDICRIVATEHGISTKTVKRHCPRI